MDDLPIRLEQFRNAFRPAGGTHGQQIGEESYALRCNGRSLTVLAEAADEIARLRSELAEVKRDAKRYRWLRRARMNVDVVVRADEDSVWIDMHGCNLDTYVDAALAAEGENNDVSA